jgi:hypothetical protein
MTQALDPTGFQMLVRVRDTDGPSYLLWTSATEGATGSPGSGLGGAAMASAGELTGIDLPVVESLEIDLNLGLNGKLTVTIAAPYDLGLRMLDSSLFKIGNVIEAQLGYPKSGRFTPWFSAMAIKPAIRIAPDDGLLATLNGEGGAFASLRSSSNKVYENTSYRDVIADIADRHRWSVQYPDGSEELDRQRESVSQGGFSDWGFINQLCRQSNVDCYMGPDPHELGRSRLFVLSRGEKNQERPVRTYVMRRQIDMINVFPILDYESDALGIWMPRSAESVRTGDINPTNKEIERHVVNQETSIVPGLGLAIATATGSSVIGDHLSQIFADARSQLDAGEYLPVSARDPSRTTLQVVQAHRDEGAVRGAMNATITAIGVPEQIPGELIAIRGTGRLDGTFEVHGMTHRAMAGEWSMTMTCMNNATQSDLIASFFQVRPPQINQQDPPEATTDDAIGGGSDVDALPSEDA